MCSKSYLEQKDKKKKEDVDYKLDIQVSVFADGMMLKRTQQLQEKTLSLIHTFSKVTGYKIDLQKSTAFPFTNNELMEKEIKWRKKQNKNLQEMEST